MGKIYRVQDEKTGQVKYPVTIDDAVVVSDINGKQTLKQKMTESWMNVLAKAEYKEFIAASNTSGSASAKYCFLKVIPKDYYSPCAIKYRITITPSASATHADKELIRGVYDIEAVITRTGFVYNTFCRFGSTTYYPIRYSVCYYLSSLDGLNDNSNEEIKYGHLLGIYTYNSYLPTTATLKRDLKVEVLGISNGTFELADSISTFASRADYSATYHATTSTVSAVIGAYHSGDQNTTYTLNYLYEAGVRKVGIGTNAISRYTLVMQKPDLTWEKIVDTSAAYTTATTKKVNTRGFLLGRLRYYNYTAVVANGANVAANYLMAQSSTFDMRYSTNCGTPADWVAGEPTFLVGTIGEDGLYYLDETKWWSNALPTEEDGKIYMQIGTIVTSASYSSTLLLEHPCYRYVNGAVERYYQGLDEKQDVITDLEDIRRGAALGATALQSNGHVSIEESGVADTGSGRSGKFETIQVKTSNGKKMVYGMCTDQTGDGTGFIGGLFAENATSFPYAGGLAIGGTSKNLLYLGKPCLSASNKTAEVGKAITGFSTANGATTFTTGSFLTEHQDISEKANLDSPTFTGIPKVPTAASSTSTSQIASTQFVQQEIDRRANSFSFTIAQGSIVIEKVGSLTSIL